MADVAGTCCMYKAGAVSMAGACSWTGQCGRCGRCMVYTDRVWTARLRSTCGLLSAGVRRCRSTASTFCQSSSSRCSTLSAEHVRSTGFLCRWPVYMELTAGWVPKSDQQHWQFQTVPEGILFSEYQCIPVVFFTLIIIVVDRRSTITPHKVIEVDRRWN